MKYLLIFLGLLLLINVANADIPITATYVNAGEPDTNFGTSPYLAIDQPHPIYTYIELPATMQVINISLYNIGWSSPASYETFQIYATTQFDEVTLTYNNRPPQGQYIKSITFLNNEEKWIRVTLNNPPKYLLFTQNYMNISGIVFSSDDSSNPPYIQSYCTSLTFTTLEWYDILGALRIIANWLWDFPSCNLLPFFQDVQQIIILIYTIISSIVTSIIAIFEFIYAILSMMVTLLSFISGFLTPLFTGSPTVLGIFAIVTLLISYTVFMRVYNILADIELFGFKLPKL